MIPIFRNPIITVFLIAILVIMQVMMTAMAVHAQTTGVSSAAKANYSSGTFQKTFNDPMSECKDMITYEGYDAKLPDDAVWNRLKLDNCTNQYIAQRSAVKEVFEPEGAPAGVDETSCQQIKIPNDPLLGSTIYYDYSISDVLSRAWDKTLVKSQDLKPKEFSGGSVGKPDNKDKILITHPICLPGAELSEDGKKCSNPANGGFGGGMMSTPEGDGAYGPVGWCSPEQWNTNVNQQWDSQVQSAAATYGLPPQFIKSVMAIESCGDAVNTATPNGAGAMGLMQVIPSIWGHLASGPLSDPGVNIDTYAKIITSWDCISGGRTDISPWEKAVRCFYGGYAGRDNDNVADNPADGGSGITALQYWLHVKWYWDMQGGEGQDSQIGDSTFSSSAPAGTFPRLMASDVLRYDPAADNVGSTDNPERILDASHIFSPRNDIVGTDRERGFTCDANGPVDLLGARLRSGKFRCASNRKQFNSSETLRVQNCVRDFYLAQEEQGIMDPVAPTAADCPPAKHCITSVLEGEANDDPECVTRFGPWGQADYQEEGDCCYEITKPVMPVNVLRLRSVATAWPNGKAPEGYAFKDYFGERRPYMRWLDTLAEADQPYRHRVYLGINSGANDAIIGVGREMQACAWVGGAGKDVQVGGATMLDVPLPGQYGSNPKLDRRAYYGSSLMELKLYQLRSRRDYHLNCLAKYEKVFKLGSAENFAMTATGGEYSFAQPLPDGGTANRGRVLPNSWRGSVTDLGSVTNPMSSYAFPFLSKNKQQAWTATKQGIDQAQAGDVIVWSNDIVKGTRRLPHVAYVRQTTRDPAAPTKNRFVEIVDYNNGKFLDVCGNSDMWGNGQIRTLYPTGKLPTNIKAALNIVAKDNNLARGSNYSCEDANLATCEEELWNSVLVYRPTEDVRSAK